MTNYLKKRGLKLLHFAYVACGCSMFQIRKLKCERNTGFTKKCSKWWLYKRFGISSD